MWDSLNNNNTVTNSYSSKTGENVAYPYPIQICSLTFLPYIICILYFMTGFEDKTLEKYTNTVCCIVVLAGNTIQQQQ